MIRRTEERIVRYTAKCDFCEETIRREYPGPKRPSVQFKKLLKNSGWTSEKVSLDNYTVCCNKCLKSK